MIKRITDIDSLSGVSSPLLPLIYADLKSTCNDRDGAFIQLDENGGVTALFSLKNTGAVLVKISSAFECDEIEAFFDFSGVTSVISDFSLNSLREKALPLLVCVPDIKDTQEISRITDKSGLCEYKSVYNLLCDKGENFDVWFPVFSRKINNGISSATYKKIDDIAVSTAVCTAIYKGTAIISGVYTAESYRNKGYACECVNALLNNLQKSEVENTYLWCENKNISFYSKLGFTQCSQVYVREEL